MVAFLHVPEEARNHMEMTGFSVSKIGSLFILGKSIDDNLYPYRCTKNESQKSTTKLRRSAKEKLSYTARRHVFTYVWPRDPKHSPFSPTLTVSCVSDKKKNSLPVSVVTYEISVYACYCRFGFGFG